MTEQALVKKYVWDWDSNQPLYEHGLPFSEKLAEQIDGANNRIAKKFASLIIIDGGVGQGKTTAGVLIAEYAQGKKLDFKMQLAMGGEDFVKKLKICFLNDLHVIVYDESGDFNSRGALTKLNALLNRIFDTYRAFKILVILILPSFQALDGSLFAKQIPRMLFNLHDRNEKQGNVRGYDLESMFWLRHYMKKIVVQPKAYQRVKPNFRAHFLNLSPEREKELDNYSTSGKLEIAEIGEIKHQGLRTIKELSHSLVKSEVWTRKKLAELGIKETKKYKNKNYYNESSYKRLAAELRK